MIRARAILAALALACASLAPVAAQARDPMPAPGDPQAIERILASADTSEPLALMTVSTALLEAGRRDEAIFWFYAGQLRARYSPKLQGENAQIVTVLTTALGEDVNAHAMRDVPALAKTFDAVIAWDEKTFGAWTKAMRLSPDDAVLLERRREKVDGLRAFGMDLLARREAVEKEAREHKTYAQQQRERAEQIERDYSQEIVEVSVAGTRFRLPVNYLTPAGRGYKSSRDHTDMGFWIFLPDFGGYRRDNWRDPGANPDAIFVYITTNSRKNPQQRIEAFLAGGAGQVEDVGKRQAKIYDSRRTRADLPIQTESRHYVLKARRADGNGAFYAICDAPQPYTTQAAPSCQMFLGETAAGVPITARFRRQHLDDMDLIEARVSGLLKSWIVP